MAEPLADPTVVSHHGIAPPLDPETELTVTLDGRPVTASPGEFLIAVAERAGTYIPRFCYHPRMKPVGMCRMCLVEVSGPRGATLQPACYVPVTDNMEVVTTSERVRKAQDGVLEMLLVNHPLDCPVCDKGGECPLQDQVLGYGPGETRFIEEKRHWAKPIAISDLVLLDRERCIQCGRCVRFAAEIAGEAQIDFLGRGDQVEVNIFEDQPFSSYFSGNTIQICPVGALTAVPYRFSARPWDVEQVETTCTSCALGCRVVAQSSGDRLTRILGMDSDPVNHSWLCDKGRFAYQAVNSPDRLSEPLLRLERGGELEPVAWPEALSAVAGRLAAVRAEHGPDAIGVIGGARLSNEDAYAWARLAKGVLGTDSVDAQLDDGLAPEVLLGLPRATVDEACRAKVVVVVAGDLREELPVLFLRLRGAALEGTTTVVEIGPTRSALAGLARTVGVRPGDSGRCLAALASRAEVPEAVDAAQWRHALDAIAAAGDDGDGVVVVLGRQSVAEHGALVAEAAAEVCAALPAARFLPAQRRGNVMGALDMGLAPGLLPGRVALDAGRGRLEEAWGSVPEHRGRGTAGILAGLADGSLRALVLLGADPLGDVPDANLAARGLEAAEYVVAVDAFLSPSAARADAVLPAAIHHERSGTTTNIEGRVTRVAQKVVAPGQAWPDWMIAVALADRLGGDLGFASTAEIWDEIERTAPAYRGVTRALLDAPAGRDGIVVPLRATPVRLGTRPRAFDPMATPGIDPVERQGAPARAGAAEPLGAGHPAAAIATGAAENEAGGKGAGPSGLLPAPSPSAVSAPRVPAPDSYSLRLVAQRRLYDDGVMLEVCDSLSPLVDPALLRVHPAELDRLGVRTGDRVRVRSGAGAVVLPVAADVAVARGVAVVGFNLASAADDADTADEPSSGGAGAGALISSAEAVTDVRLESL